MPILKKYSFLLILKLRLLLQNHEQHKKTETEINGSELNLLAASFCFHDHEAQPELSVIHFSKVPRHGRVRALLYTLFLYK